MGIAFLRVVADVRDHAGGDEHFSDPLAEKFAMNRGAQSKGKRDFYLPCQLSVATVLDPIDGVPQRSAVFCPCRCMRWHQDFRPQDLLFPRVVVDPSGEI